MAIKLGNDSKVLLGVALIALLLISITAVVANHSASEDLTLSTYSSYSGGAKATYLLISSLGYSVERWNSAPSALPTDAQDSLLIEMNPVRRPTDEERAAIDVFIERGGTLVIAGNSTSLFAPEMRTRFEFPSESWKNHPAMVPQALNQGVGTIAMPDGLYVEADTRDLPLYGEGEKPVAITREEGKGRIIWLASPVPFSNAGMQAKGNPEFLANILAVGGSRRVFWDLYFSTDAAGKRSPIKAPALLAGGAQLLFIFGLVVWTHSRRSGPLRAFNDAPAAMSQMEFVDSLGAIYRNAKATNVVVQIAYARLAYLAARRFGLSAKNVNKLGEAIARATGEPPKEVVDFLTECDNIQHHGVLSEQQAIEHVQRLQAYLMKLKLTSGSSQEKH